MAEDYATTEDPQALAPLPPPPPMQTSAYEVEKPNPLLGFLVGALTGRDLLGQQHDAEQAAENAQFWKQTNFAKYQLSKREDLSKEYSESGDKFLSQQASLNQMRVQLGVMKLSNAPPDAVAPIAQGIKDQEMILNHIRNDLEQRRAGVQQIDATMGPMIAHMTPPPSVWSGGQGDAFSKARPGGKSTPAPSGDGAAPSTPPSAEQMTPQQAAMAPVQHWKDALEKSGLGFPTTRSDGSPNGVVVGNRVQYFAETSQQAKDMQDQLDSLQKLPQFGGLRAPVDIVDTEKARQQVSEEAFKLRAEERQSLNKASFWRAQEITPPKTQELIDSLKMAVAMNDDERASELQTVIGASEERRKSLFVELRKRHEDQAAIPRRTLDAYERPLQGHAQDLLRNSGVNLVAPEQKDTATAASNTFELGSAPPKGMSDPEFRDYYIALKNYEIQKMGHPGQNRWDPKKPQDWQRQELQDALKKYRAGQ